MPSPQFEAIVQYLFANRTPVDVPIEQQRAGMEMMSAQSPLPDDVYAEEITADSVPTLLLAAPGAHDDCLVIYLHGGGYCLGSPTTHRDLGWRLSAAAAARVVMVDYGLAPEHPFPAALDDTLTVYHWLLAQGFDPAKIAIAGDSAGGGLTIATLLALRDAGERLPVTAVCLSPWLDLAGTGESMLTKAALDPILYPAWIGRFAQYYLGDGDRQNPLASPLYADLAGLPPLLIQVGTNEIVYDDATRFAAKAEAAGVDVTLDIWQDMIHVWQAFAAVMPESQQAIAQIGEYIQTHMAAN